MHRLSALLSRCSAAYILLSCLAAQVSASYFVISQPQNATQWVNGNANLVQWEKGLLDGVYGFDVEMARLSQDGLMLLAMNVPATQGKLNLYLQDVPAGDDYFLIFINSTNGILHATSSRFEIMAASSTPTAPASLTAAPGVPTVTVSGGPNPTQQFSTTFPAIASHAGRRRSIDAGLLAGVLATGLGVLLGAGWTALW